jgi:Transposase DDE domain
MNDQAIIIYCICEEVVKALNIKDDIQCKMSTAEVMTFVLQSAMLYGCNYKKTKLMASWHRYFKKILSHSQLVRRIHLIPDYVWNIVFEALKTLLRNASCKTFIIDSYPIKTYQNHKSYKAQIFAQKYFHGYSASKKEYFFGIKVHMVIDTEGVPMEFIFTPASSADILGLKTLSLNLPKNSILLGDKAYNCYELEDQLIEVEEIKLLVKRKSNQKRQNTFEENSLLKKRNFIETVFSSIISRMPRHIHARTEKGFYLKIQFFILAYMVNLYFPLS